MAAQGLHHVAVSHLGLDQVDARLGHRLAKAEVGHDGGHHQVVTQPAVGLPVPGDDRHDHVAVGGHPVLVDGDEAIGVPIEGQPDPAPGAGGQELGMGGAAPVVDVHPVGLGGQHLDVGLEPGEQLGGGLEGGPVGAVERQVESPQAVDRHSGQVSEVLVEGVGVDHAHADGSAHRRATPPVAQPPLDRPLLSVGQLGAVLAQQLDPVVGGRVVGGGDDRSHPRRRAMSEDADPPGGKDADIDGVDPHRLEPGREGGGDHGAGAAGIATDEDRPVVVLGSGGAADGEGELGGELGPRLAPDPVGAEDGLSGLEQGPQVSQRRRLRSALGVLRGPASLAEAVLLALHPAGVPGEETRLLQRVTQLGIEGDQGPGDPEAQGVDLSGDAPALQGGIEVVATLGAGDLEGLHHPHALGHGGEVGLE